MRCYKYMEFKWGVEAFKTGEFHLGSPATFNDPFDCLGGSVGRISLDACARWIGACPNHFRADLLAQIGIPEIVLRASMDDIVSYFWEKLQYPRQTYIFDQLERQNFLDRYFRILCVTSAAVEDYSAYDDALMWSHYAEEGRGIRIELELEDKQEIGHYSMKRVTYSEKRPVIDLSKVTFLEDDKVALQHRMDCIWTKSPAWKYEHEIRRVYTLSHTNPFIRLETKSDGTRHAFAKIGKDNIKDVVFGPRCDLHAARELMYAYRHEKFHMSLATESPDEYRFFYGF